MNTQLQTTSGVAPAVAESIDTYNRLQTVRSVLAPDLNDQELQLFAMVAQRSGLDPFAKQIYAIKRQGRVTFQTGIDGFRSTAERTGEYAGSDLPEFGDDQNGHPEWAQVTVYRIKGDVRFGQSARAYWSEFYPGDAQGHMWKKMPRNQLAKCAEALALRKAFPYTLSDIYTPEEMDQAGPATSGALERAAAQPSARERIAARRAALEAQRTEATEGEFTETGCGWRLGQGKNTIECTFAPGHEGDHSWNDLAISKGGRVIQPETDTAATVCGSELGGQVCSLVADHDGPHKSAEGVWPQESEA